MTVHVPFEALTEDLLPDLENPPLPELRAKLSKLRALGLVAGVQKHGPDSPDGGSAGISPDSVAAVEASWNKGEVRWTHELLPRFLTGEIHRNTGDKTYTLKELGEKHIWWKDSKFATINAGNVSRRVTHDDPFSLQLLEPSEFVALSELLWPGSPRESILAQCQYHWQRLMGGASPAALDSDLHLLTVVVRAVLETKEALVDSTDADRSASSVRDAAERCLEEKLPFFFGKTLKYPHPEWKAIAPLDPYKPEPPNTVVWTGQVDGARMVSRGFPLWCISVAVGSWKGGELEEICAVVYSPPLDEMFVGVARGGALLLKVRERSVYEIAPPKSIEDDTGMIGTHFSTDPANYQRTRDFVENVATCLAEQNERIVALGTGNLSLCWASVGRLDGYLNWSVTPPYVLPGKIIFEAAQKPAKVTDGTGRPWAITARSVCASPHEKIARDLTSLTAKLGGAP